jgi:hypothetical protein
MFHDIPGNGEIIVKYDTNQNNPHFNCINIYLSSFSLLHKYRVSTKEWYDFK